MLRFCRSLKPMRLQTPLLACLVVLLATVSEAPADLVETDWARETSPNFEVLGPLSQREARQLAADLELFREVVVVLTGLQVGTSPVPTRIVAVARPSQWVEIGLPTETGRLFLPSWRENLIALKEHDEPSHLMAVKHDYVHFLIARPNHRDVPLWYEEGFADLLSTVQMKRDRVAIGLVPDWVEAPLAMGNWIPLRKVIAPDDLAEASPTRKHMLRAESWALVHYLMIGGEYSDSFMTRLDAYMKGIAAGKDSVTAFEQAFEVDVAVLDQKLTRYVERKRYPGLALPTDRFAMKGEIVASRPSKAEIAVTIGRLRAAIGERAGAKEMFERAIALDPKSADAHAALGEALLSEHPSEEASREFDRAAALAPDDPNVQLDQARLWLDRAATRSDLSSRASDVAEARKHLSAAWKLDPEAPETYALLGRSYLLLRDDPPRAVEMLEGAERILAADPAIQLMLAEAYLALGRDADAETRLRAVVSNPHADASESQRAEEQLAAIAAKKAKGADTPIPNPAAPSAL